MLPIIYRQSPPDPAFDYLGHHSLALLFVILALGALLDPHLPPFAEEAVNFSQASRKALAQQQIYNRPSMCTVQCLQLTSLYLAIYGGDNIEDARSYMSQASRISYVVRGSAPRPLTQQFTVHPTDRPS